jgi:hypothetical protein
MALSLLTISSCTEPKPSKSVEIFTVFDVTASAQNNQSFDLDTDKIIRLFGLDEDPKISATYLQSLITDVSQNFQFSAKLSPINPSKYNKYKRLGKIKKFSAKIKEALSRLENTEFERNSSNIFLSLSKIINQVAKSGADEQIIIIQSDMLNHSPLFSAYNSRQMRKLKNNPEMLVEILEKGAPIIESLNMHIYIINQPLDATSDRAFQLISNIYKDYLISKGCTVDIVANLNI